MYALRVLIALILFFSVSCVQAQEDKDSLPDLSFYDVFHLAVEDDIDKITEHANFALYCFNIDSYLFFNLDDEKRYTISPVGLAELFDPYGRNAIKSCQQNILNEGKFGKGSQVESFLDNFQNNSFSFYLHLPETSGSIMHGAMVKVFRERAKKRIDAMIELIYSSWLSGQPACLQVGDSTESDCLIQLTSFNKNPEPLIDLISDIDEVKRARKLIHACALLSTMGDKDILFQIKSIDEPYNFSSLPDRFNSAQRNSDPVIEIIRRRNNLFLIHKAQELSIKNARDAAKELADQNKKLDREYYCSTHPKACGQKDFSGSKFTD